MGSGPETWWHKRTKWAVVNLLRHEARGPHQQDQEWNGVRTTQRNFKNSRDLDKRGTGGSLAWSMGLLALRVKSLTLPLPAVGQSQVFLSPAPLPSVGSEKRARQIPMAFILNNRKRLGRG